MVRVPQNTYTLKVRHITNHFNPDNQTAVEKIKNMVKANHKISLAKIFRNLSLNI
jgi:hypothetical protein